MPQWYRTRGQAPSRAAAAASGMLAVASLVMVAPALASGLDQHDDTCVGRHHDAGGVTILATQDGQVLAGTDVADVLDADGHLGVTASGNGGDDFICGGPGADVLDGGGGRDWIQGLGGDDVVHGDEGDDIVEGDAGNDQVFGDAGDDDVAVSNARYGEADGRSHDTDTADGGAGHDELDIGARLGSSTSMTVDASAGTADVPEGMSVDFTGFEAYAGPGRHATFVGSSGDDWVYGGFTVIDLGAGDDYAEIGPAVFARAGAGDDRIEAIDGGTARGGAGNDLLHLTFQEGSLPDGATRFEGGAGDDTFDIDSFYSSGRTWDHDPVDARFQGGAGTDVIDLAHLHFPVRADLGRQRASWDESRFAWSDVEVFDGSARADHLRGSAGDDVVNSQGGRDIVHGLGGDDVLVGGGGRDVLWGGPGHDTCQAEVRHLCEAS